MWLTTCQFSESSHKLSKTGSINILFPTTDETKHLVHWELHLNQHHITHENSVLSSSNCMQEITYDLV